jgi:glucokinase
MGLNGEQMYALGIDVGGTNIKAGLVDDQGRVMVTKVFPTAKEKGAKYVLTQLEKVINILRDSTSAKIRGVGLALPGAVDDNRGLCLFCPNLGWNELEISQGLAKSTGLSVKLVNDANAACLGEYFYGGGQGTEIFLSITLGTGVGSGLIFANRLCTGLSGSGVEAGHMVIEPGGVQCTCGGRGCWETIVSAPAILRRTIEKVKDFKDSLLAKEIVCSFNSNDGNNCDTTGNKVNKGNIGSEDNQGNTGNKVMHNKAYNGLTTEMIFQAFREKDPLAQIVVEETIYYLALGLANLINLFNPDKISLGGGVAEAEEIMTSRLFDQINRNVFPTLKNKVEIYKSIQGYYGGVLGAASLWFHEIDTI